ncbi:MAG: hypothetical protein K2V38_10110, partial [Gemmataceae bacterium]|nr:hypothetical protein [Gemmataceae bacterium]
MPQDATCPACQHAFPVSETRGAFTVECPKCDAAMTAEFKTPDNPPEPGQPPFELVVRKGAAADVPPIPATRRQADDEDQAAKGGSSAIVLLSGGFGIFAVLGGLALTAWFLFFYVDTTPAVANNSNNNRNQPNQPNQPNNPNPRPNPNPNPGPIIPPKPKDEFELKPRTGTVPPILPPALPADVSNIDLISEPSVGGKVGAVAVGGGGRYLVMHAPDKGKLAVFDVNEARFVASVSADNGDAMLTAGLGKVVLAPPNNARIFRVYNLPDLAKQYDSSGVDNLRGLAMGARTNGPLASIGTFGEIRLWDIDADGLREVEGAAGKPGVHWHEKCLRASPDGTAFSTHDQFFGHNKTTLLTVQNRKWKVTQDVAAVPFPGADGNFYGNGIAVNKTGQDHKIGGIGAGSGTWFVPSVSSKDYFLKLAPLTVGTGVKAKKTLAVSIHKGRNSETPAAGTAALQDPPEIDGLVDRFRPDPIVAYDQHFFLIPEAKLLITITAKRDRIVLRRI